MNRKQPTTPVPAVTPNDQPNNGPKMVTEIRKYEVITPLYGGGEEPGKPDSVTVVRAAEVRGHLRFWWRATRGGQFNGSLEKMMRREEEIWGSSGEKGKPGPSRIVVSVLEANTGTKIDRKEVSTSKGKEIKEIADPRSPWSYVAFPLRSEPGKKAAGAVYVNVSFTLEIRYPQEFKEDVEAALWAWETFGGIGARTRRGFGALRREGTPLGTCLSAKNAILQGLKKYVVQGKWPAGVPHLTQGLRFECKTSKDPVSAWEILFTRLKNFRQMRLKGATSPGRSYWPEPDEIRRLTQSAHAYHKPKHPVKKFPRAKFGLPIIFQFKDKKDGDPDQTSLEGLNQDRLASPLILRPIQCADGAVGLAAILEWEPLQPGDEPYTPPGGLKLKGAPNDPRVKSNLTLEEAKQILPLNGKTDVLQAFLDTLK